MEWQYPAYNVEFTVDRVNARNRRFDDKVTVSYLTVDGDEGEMTMLGSELRSLNSNVWGHKKDNWNINLADVIGDTGVTEVTVKLENAETHRRASRATSKVWLRHVKYCGNEN